MATSDFAALVAVLRILPMTREEWAVLDLALRAIWRERFEGPPGTGPVRL